MTANDDPGSRVRALAARAFGVEPGAVAIEPLRAGLGARRFFRARALGTSAPRTAIARVDMPEDPALRPAGVAPEPPLEPIRALLESRGLPVPRRLAHERGIELLEDAGDLTLERVAREAPAHERRALYARACAIAAELQRVARAPGVAAFERRLDRALFAYKADQVATWLLPAAFGRAATAAERAVVDRAFDEVADRALAAPQRLAHRDFKAQNLHVVDRGAGAELVLIDLQGAFLAPPEYDLVCLLRDLHVALADEEIDEQLARVRPQLPDAPSEAELRERFDLLTLSRVGKDTARFVWAVRERGDERYRAYVPNGVRSLQRAAAALATRSPALADLAELAARIPESPCAR
ncbi:MAG: phosphotransferase [Myxococcales bacterium]|nr:phosphotransferase [Myxococcales bacterium]